MFKLFASVCLEPRRCHPRCRNCLYITPLIRTMSCFWFVLFTNGAFIYSVICFQCALSHKFHCGATCKRNYVIVSMVLDLLVSSPYAYPYSSPINNNYGGRENISSITLLGFYHMRPISMHPFIRFLFIIIIIQYPFEI